MDKPIQMAIGVGLAIAAMAIVGVYVFGVIGGSTVSTDIVPKTLDAISSNQGKNLQLSVSLTNQGSGSIDSVKAALRVDVKKTCGTAASTGQLCSVTTDGGKPGVIYFPISYSTDVVESFGTINIRNSIDTIGSAESAVDGYGCKDVIADPPSTATPPSTGKKLTNVAGFNSLDNAIKYYDAKDLQIFKDTSATNDVKGSGDYVTVGINNVICARDLGVFAGEEITLTVIAETTSGDTVERIIPLTVR